MDDASKRYQSSKFIYNDEELRFSTREKKLVDSEFDTSFIDSAGGVVTDRAGHLLGYIHTEAQTFSSFIVPFVAVLDLQHKKFRHFNLGTDPKFKAALNRAYPGLWKRLEARNENGFGIERYKVVGFQQRQLIFKVELTDFKTSQSVFAGFWSYSLATGQVKLVSQKSNAPIKVEFKGTATEIDVRDEGG
jgi:hypothetical protein